MLKRKLYKNRPETKYKQAKKDTVVLSCFNIGHGYLAAHLQRITSKIQNNVKYATNLTQEWGKNIPFCKKLDANLTSVNCARLPESCWTGVQANQKQQYYLFTYHQVIQ